uniref:Uncharacterized protein n=1 Tax=uncultured prokaryote TaxID=198431 RepID=A0A0H5Q794_9ZZZZ|nr:hypothetical protein [uncultured prokaryote]
MAIYRMQVVHVGYWRGKIKRWNNTFHYLAASGTPDLPGITASAYAVLQSLGSEYYHGGLAEIKIYSESGGVPAYSKIYFDWETKADWISYTGTFWGTGTIPVNSAGESAAIFQTAAGMSSSGKPVSLRTYWHAFIGGAHEAGTVDFDSTTQATAAGIFEGMQSLAGGSGPAFVLVSPSGGSVATVSTLDAYIGAHQRVRGRRKASVMIDGKKYYPAAKSASVVPVEAD